jgi:hypothetical protein
LGDNELVPIGTGCPGSRDFAAVQPGTNGWGKGPKGRIDLAHYKRRRFDEIINKIFGVPE